MVPDIYWFVFWCAVFALMFAGLFWGGWNTHRVHMKTLEVLRLYAEKGTEPPPELMDQLSRQLFDQRRKEEAASHAASVGKHLGQFIGNLTAAGAVAGIAWWWVSQRSQPEWAAYALGTVAIMFAAGGISQLVAAVVVRGK